MSIPFVPTGSRRTHLGILTLGSRLPRATGQVGIHAVLVTSILARSSRAVHALSLTIRSVNVRLTLATSITSLDNTGLRLRGSPSVPVLATQLTRCSLPAHVFGHIYSVILSLITVVLDSPVVL